MEVINLLESFLQQECSYILWNLKLQMEITIIGKDISQLLGNYVFCFFFFAAGNNILFKINLYPGELG